MKIRFETEQYVAAHGHAPRGCGSWIFEVAGLDNGAGNQVRCQGTYSVAKKHLAVALRCMHFQPSGGVAVAKVCS